MTRRWVPWARWLTLYVVATLIVSIVAQSFRLRPSFGMLLYLLLIVGASQQGGRWLAAVMVALSYVAVDYYFVPPRRAFGVPTELDLVLLAAFVITASVIAQLQVRLRHTVTVATERALEIERMSAERLELAREAARADVLVEAERLKNTMLASVSHDLRSPIMAIALLADPDSPVPAAEVLPQLRERAKQLTDYLSTLHRFATPSHEGTMLKIESYAVDDLIGTVLRSAVTEIADHPIRVASNHADVVLLVRCDFTLSLQILGNLLQNAARYSPAGSPIELEAVGKGHEVRITVSDRGPGIAESDVVAMFRPTCRGAATATVAGSGMGLSIAQTFARAQGGDVTYRPRAEGGSHFDFVLPIGILTAPASG